MPSKEVLRLGRAEDTEVVSEVYLVLMTPVFLFRKKIFLQQRMRL